MAGSVIRVIRPGDPFTRVPNETVEDRRLSPCALGVLVRLLQKPPTWDIRARQIEAENRIGRDARRTIFREMEAAGYARRYREQLDDGKWVQITEVYAISRFQTEGGLPGVGSSECGSTGAEKNGDIHKKDKSKTYDTKNPRPDLVKERRGFDEIADAIDLPTDLPIGSEQRREIAKVLARVNNTDDRSQAIGEFIARARQNSPPIKDHVGYAARIAMRAESGELTTGAADKDRLQRTRAERQDRDHKRRLQASREQADKQFGHLVTAKSKK